MANDITQANRNRININEPEEVREWSEKYNISRDKLKQGVTAVGPLAKDIENWLKKNR